MKQMSLDYIRQGQILRRNKMQSDNFINETLEEKTFRILIRKPLPEVKEIMLQEYHTWFATDIPEEEHMDAQLLRLKNLYWTRAEFRLALNEERAADMFWKVPPESSGDTK